MKYQIWAQFLRLVFFTRLAVLSMAILGLLLAGHWIFAIFVGLAGLFFTLDHEGTA